MCIRDSTCTELSFHIRAPGFFSSDAPANDPPPPKLRLIPDLDTDDSPAYSARGGVTEPRGQQQVSWQQMFGVEERDDAEPAEVKSAGGTDPEAAMRAYAVQRSAEE
eukprot:7062341-Pyramimonas_sp.AAC.1